MELRELQHSLGADAGLTLPEGSFAALPIMSITEDSRRVVPGAMFVAAPGVRVDGHAFVEQAIAAGAVAILGEREPSVLKSPTGVLIPYIHSAHARRALGHIAHALQGNPTRAMSVVGVTGTNGKTSVARLIQHVLNTSGRSAACFGTVAYYIGGEEIPAPHTTPFGEALAELFGKARAAGHDAVVMEASSHALEQERVAGVRFQVAAFTNLTQDHLDYHPSMEAYRRAKEMLFERIADEHSGPGPCFGVVNAEDPASEYFQKATSRPCFRFGGKGDVRAREVQLGLRDTKLALETPWGRAELRLRLLGQHNVSNVLCAVAVCGGMGVPFERIVQAMSEATPAPGRFEHVDAGQPFSVVVDYAHTEDGLRNVLHAARAICQGRVLCVFGCGGDRDKTKRPKMGEAAAELANLIFVTSDNPRSEEPERIILDIEMGIQRSGKRKGEDYFVNADRREAIEHALSMARSGDLVLIAGKGHENYQIIGAQRNHFDDREVAREALHALPRR